MSILKCYHSLSAQKYVMNNKDKTLLCVFFFKEKTIFACQIQKLTLRTKQLCIILPGTYVHI